MVSYSFIYILTFIITALWDVVLRFMSENYEKLPKWLQWFNFIEYLKPYFQKHTLLAAALIAGFIGFGAQVIILNLHKLPNNFKTFTTFMIVTFVVSALYGFVMKLSRLFPYLDDTYYKRLGVIRSMYHDGISGLIVQVNLLVLLYFIY